MAVILTMPWWDRQRAMEIRLSQTDVINRFEDDLLRSIPNVQHLRVRTAIFGPPDLQLNGVTEEIADTVRILS